MVGGWGALGQLVIESTTKKTQFLLFHLFLSSGIAVIMFFSVVGLLRDFYQPGNPPILLILACLVGGHLIASKMVPSTSE